MTKDRTPPQNEWKMKAIQRREENEQLRERLQNLESKVNRLEGTLKQANDNVVDDLKKQLEIANKIIAHQQEEILEFKKKA
jgi:predicted nuclease with TOPRIM domain